MKEERPSNRPYFFGHAREPLQQFRVNDSELKACFCAVMEEDGSDDFESSSGKSERNFRNADDVPDVRELLFDETD